jgi:hypothetical protein
MRVYLAHTADVPAAYLEEARETLGRLVRELRESSEPARSESAVLTVS